MSSPPRYTDEPAPGSKPAKTYGAATTDLESSVPLLASTSRNAWMDQPASDELPDDFKIGVLVIDCDEEIRRAFVRKVYSILSIQLLATAIVSAVLRLPAAVAFHQDHPWMIYIPMLGSFAALGGVYWKRHQHPANLILLGLFTMFEAMLVGTVVSYYDSKIVLQALFITLGVFAGLTLFTFQTKFDFSSFGPFLFAGIMGLLTASLVSIFLPFDANLDLGIACFSVLLFSGFVLYDTQQILKRFSVDEYCIATLTLYLDVLNLFLSILRILNNQNNR
ncbi:vacuolar protein [Tremella mesenterica]|uniref:Vacuolar protein n=1 Tax=Tremella mesenterica TaxID=5217 RepID=A0A4Q1BRE9_TREME|nr:uncharacterized protein TREMEDRAFT_41527 [Tremella mesenterica DSM 1558]EIW72118.1 hypothetical protein TREMEDRAFT_41527 [Tremella mesenterica DSM 1558]RXK40556.1 vacuolar protein [Tremella mesenterica]